MKSTDSNEKTCERLKKHYSTYPELQAEDVLKYIFQSVFGCEHFVSDEDTAIRNIRREYATVPETDPPRIDALDGRYSRVHLSCMNDGLSPETLAKLFCASAKQEADGMDLLLQKLGLIQALVQDAQLPLDPTAFHQRLNEWRACGYPAIHHSQNFRAAYHPAYRVIANEYVPVLPLLSEIDRRLRHGSAIIAIEGGSASGKTTLAAMLHTLYDCNVLHMDDFFLRPEQRTAARYAEVGGNIDRERFEVEVLKPLAKNEIIRYRRFNCEEQMLGPSIEVIPKRLTVIEGVYSMHPAFSRYYDFSVFLNISPPDQKERILKRNSPQLATRFFEEWIPLENAYFLQMDIQKKADLVLSVPIDE